MKLSLVRFEEPETGDHCTGHCHQSIIDREEKDGIRRCSTDFCGQRSLPYDRETEASDLLQNPPTSTTLHHANTINTSLWRKSDDGAEKADGTSSSDVWGVQADAPTQSDLWRSRAHSRRRAGDGQGAGPAPSQWDDGPRAGPRQRLARQKPERGPGSAGPPGRASVGSLLTVSRCVLEYKVQ